ncbi:restriction endonuclease subunit S [Microbulbifer agarilyticus]
MAGKNLSPEWCLIELQELGQIVTGKTPSTKNPDNFGGEIPFIKPGDLDAGGYIRRTADTLTEAGADSVPTLPENSIAVTCIGNLGKVGITTSVSATNQQINSIIPSRSLDYRFLYHQLCTLKPWLESEASATTVAIINKGKFSKAPIALPPLAEQKVIADKLDTLLAQVENTKARLERIPQILKRFRQSVLAAAMRGDLTETWRESNPAAEVSVLDYDRLIESSTFKLKAKNLCEPENQASWLSCSIGHIFTVRSGDGLTAKQMNPEGKIPVYGGNGINGYHDKSNINYRAVVIGRVGFYCGSVHMTEEKAWVTDNALIASYPEALVTNEFAFWLLNATNLREDAASSAQPVISGTKIYPIQIALPPIGEQKEIVRRLEQLFAYADTIEKQVNDALARVEHLTQSILAKAFRGELTEQWRKDNPGLISGDNSAQALLERIQAERASAKPKKSTRRKKIAT